MPGRKVTVESFVLAMILQTREGKESLGFTLVKGIPQGIGQGIEGHQYAPLLSMDLS